MMTATVARPRPAGVCVGPFLLASRASALPFPENWTRRRVIDFFTQQLMLAQNQAPAAGADDPYAFLRMMLPLVFIMVLFYFMLVRPQKRKEQELRNMVHNLKENDRVVTIGGIYGVVTNVQRDA
jgi:preprotein translocase YajC subunit